MLATVLCSEVGLGGCGDDFGELGGTVATDVGSETTCSEIETASDGISGAWTRLSLSFFSSIANLMSQFYFD